MVATRRARSNNAAPAGKKVLKDVTNARGRELPGKIQDAGPQTAPPNEGAIARRTRSSRKKPLADVGRTGDGPIATEDPAEATEPVRLEEKFERAADEERGKKKRKALEVIEIDQNVQPRRTRRAARQAGRKSTGGEADAKKVTEIDLTCDERLVADRGLLLASGSGVGAAEEVYPFSVNGGRRSNERKHALAPYVKNGHLFTVGMRQSLVDWMSQQHSSLDLVDETLHLAVRYLDTFLVRRGTESFLMRNGAGSEPVPAEPLPPLESDRVMYLSGHGAWFQPLCNKLKRLGITCIFVAAKVTEVSAPSAYEFADAAEVSTFTRSQLLLAERALLRELEYCLYHPTTSSFASAYLSEMSDSFRKVQCDVLKVSVDEKLTDPSVKNAVLECTDMVDYVLEASTISQESLRFVPSALAAAAVGFVCEHGFKMKWSQLEPLRTLSGYDKKRLEPEYDFLHKLMRDVKAEEREGRGMNVNDKYHTAAEDIWRRLEGQ